MSTRKSVSKKRKWNVGAVNRYSHKDRYCYQDKINALWMKRGLGIVRLFLPRGFFFFYFFSFAFVILTIPTNISNIEINNTIFTGKTLK